MHKTYISADELLSESFEMALNIYESGFRPDLIVGVWRGGTPVAIAVHELFDYLGADCDHYAIRTSSYTGIGERSKEVKVFGLDYIAANRDHIERILLVDDVFDSGLSLQAVVERIQQLFTDKKVDIKLATPYFKPSNNLSNTVPDYYLRETSDWLVFPHELSGLSLDEVLTHKNTLTDVAERLKATIAIKRS